MCPRAFFPFTARRPVVLLAASLGSSRRYPRRGLGRGSASLEDTERARFEPEHGTIEGYLFNSFRSALKNVRSKYGRTRIRLQSGDTAYEHDLVPLDEMNLSDSSFSEHRLHLVIRANQVLAHADAAMRDVIERIYFAGEDRKSALREIGLDRFAFLRQCRRIGREINQLNRCA